MHLHRHVVMGCEETEVRQKTPARHTESSVRWEERGRGQGQSEAEAERRGERESRGKHPGCWVSELEIDPALSLAGCSSLAQGGTLRLISFCQSPFSCLFPDAAGPSAERRHCF